MHVTADPQLRPDLAHEVLAVVDPVAGEPMAPVLRRQRGRDRRPVGNDDFQEAGLFKEALGLQPMGFQVAPDRPGRLVTRLCLKIGNDPVDPVQVACVAPAEQVRIPGRAPDPAPRRSSTAVARSGSASPGRSALPFALQASSSFLAQAVRP